MYGSRLRIMVWKSRKKDYMGMRHDRFRGHQQFFHDAARVRLSRRWRPQPLPGFNGA
jgi:hypothetical protein